MDGIILTGMKPEPVAEYDGYLSENLNVADYELADVTRRLKIDEFVASVALADSALRARIAEILIGISPRRIGRWLDWLQGRSWSGHSLLLFLEFRFIYWEETPEWWESGFWNKGWREWFAYSNPSSSALSRDATYDLVQARLDRQAEDIIDDSWLEDWECLTLWKFGFPSFASFAVFRASISEGEDWLCYIEMGEDSEFYAEIRLSPLYKSYYRQDIEETLETFEGRSLVWDERLPYRNLRNGQEWFAIQDWYSPDEWHDGLGWSHGTFEDTLPVTLPDRDMTSPYVELPYRSPDES